jgi:predicted RNase H-like HicB family nuclease
MLTEYLEHAMSHATYEHIEDGTYYGSIPGFAGVWANAPSEAAAHDELRDVLEGWILLQVADHIPLPTVDGLTLPIGTPA